MTRLIKIAGWDRRRGSVIFVHGLGGHALDSWRRGKDRGSFWPDWLSQDIEGLDIYSLSYAAPALNWLGTAMPLQDRAVNVLECLLGEPALRESPVAFVCHSLGGLVVKQVIREAEDRKARAPQAAQLLSRIDSIVFIATPHAGSAHANLIDRLRVIVWPSAATQNLVANDPALRNLNVWYRHWSAARAVKHVVFYEMQGTAAGVIVGPASSDPGLANANLIPVDADHVSICKPEDRSSLLYARTRDFLAGMGAAVQAGLRAAPPLPELKREWPRHYGPLALRLAVIAVLGFVAFSGVQALLSPQVTPAAVAAEMESLQRQLSDRNIHTEIVVRQLEQAGIRRSQDRSRPPGQAEVLAMQLDLIGRYKAALKQLETVKPVDSESRALVARANDKLRAGEVDSVNPLVEAVRLRNRLAQEISFRRREGDDGSGLITFTNRWDEQNIITVFVPQIAKIPPIAGQPPSGYVKFHKSGERQLKAVFADLEKADLLGDITAFCGSYVPRLIQGSQTQLSVHAFGIAIDINCNRLKLGRLPEKEDDLAAINRLIPVFERHGFVWGGRMATLEPFHFQLARFD